MAKEEWIFHGMSLSQRGKWDVEEVLEGIGIPRYRGSDLQVPFSHGSRWIKKRFDRRKVVLSMWIKGKDREELDLHIDEFLRGIGSPGQHSLQRILRNGEVREAMGEVCTEIHFVRKGPGYAKFALEVELADPFFYGTTLQTDTRSITTGVLEWIHTNSGSAPCSDMIIKFQGPLANPVLRHKGSGIWVQFMGVIAAGETVVLDTGSFTCTEAVDNLISALYHGGDSHWMSLDTGMNELKIETGTSGGSVSIEYYPPFF